MLFVIILSALYHRGFVAYCVIVGWLVERLYLGTEMRTRYCLPGSVFSPIVKKGAENFYNGLWSCSSCKAPTGPSLSILETHVTAFYKNYPLVPIADR